jgi:IS1 family transposase
MENDSSTSLLAIGAQKPEKNIMDQIKGLKMNKIATDYCKPYDNFIPEDKHVRSKAETFRHSFRHFHLDTFI